MLAAASKSLTVFLSSEVKKMISGPNQKNIAGEVIIQNCTELSFPLKAVQLV